MGYDDDRPVEHAGRASRRGRRGRRGGGPVRFVAWTVGALTLLAVLTVAGYAFFLQRTVADNIEHEDLKSDRDSVITISPDGARQPGQEDAERTDDAGGAAPGEGNGDGNGDGSQDEEDELAPVVDEQGRVIDVTGTEVPVTVPDRDPGAGDSLNFLVIGTDSRDLSVERGRSDVIVLMHVNDERDRVDLVHFPRDLFVPIAGTGGSSKINAAYAYGGAPLLVQTLQPLVGVPIDHVVIVDFDSFKAMTDAIGGVSVQVTEAGGGFSVGTHHMNGEQGLRFVRERYSLSQGDISRGERQMQFVKAVMLKALSRDTLTNPVRLANFVNAATTNLRVSEGLRVGEMRDLGFAMRDVRGGDIHFWQGPWCGIASHPVAGSIVLMSESQMGVLGQHLRSDSMESYVDNVSPRSGFSGSC